MNVNMGRKTALRNTLILIMIQQVPLSFIDNSPIDIEEDAISNFNNSEKHHIFPKKFLKSQGIKEKKANDLLVNFCLIDSALNKYISGKSPNDYFSEFKEQNKELKKSLDSHLIPSDNDSGIWSDDYKTFIQQRAEILYRQVKNRIGDFTTSIEEQMKSSPALLIQKLEQNIREIINSILHDSLGENWWEVEDVVPQDVRDYAKNQVKKERANKPYITEQEWKTPMRQLEQINVTDYPKIILKNWNKFEDIFGSKQNLQQHFSNFFKIRNQIAHIKTIDTIERKLGEASIQWLFECIRKNTEKQIEEGTDNEQIDFLFIHDLYEELKKNILALDPEIKENEKKNYKGFTKKHFVNFALLQLRKGHILVRILVHKGELNDPKSITVDKTKKEGMEKRKIYFEIHSKDEIDYAMELIKQAYNFNELLCKRKTELKARHYKRYDFWSGLLKKAKEKNADFQNLSPTYYHWIGKGGGKRGVDFNFVITQNNANVEIYFDTGKKEPNKEMFDYLHGHKKDIENVFKENLDWQRLDSKRASRIMFKFDGIGLFNKELWEGLQDKMVDKMILLEKAFKPFIEQLE